MTNAVIRQELHHIIDIADDAKVEAMYNIIQGNMSNEKYTAAELAEFYGRLDKYNKGEMPGFSVEEAHNYVRANGKGK
jgi:hypothetical protein